MRMLSSEDLVAVSENYLYVRAPRAANSLDPQDGIIKLP